MPPLPARRCGLATLAEGMMTPRGWSVSSCRLCAASHVAYLRHHLSLAGRADPLFADDALSAIHDASRGKPREINNLARNALLAGYTERKNIIDHACIRAAITEASTDHKTP